MFAKISNRLKHFGSEAKPNKVSNKILNYALNTKKGDGIN